MKMKDVFDLPVFAKMHGVGDRCTMFEGKGVTVASSFYANRLHAYDAMCHAINNHDKLTEENARLREALTELVQLANHPLTVDALDITQSTEMDRAKKLLKGDEDECI